MYRSYWIDRVGVVVWTTVETEDALALRREMQHRHERLRSPLVLIMDFPEGLPFPGPEVRAVLKEHGTPSLKLCSTAFSVIEGNGVAASLFRTANRALLTVMGLAKMFRTCETIDMALESLPPEVKSAKDGLRRLLEKDGILLSPSELQPWIPE